jgi:uncharacterized protein involved in exopolysaccharide biosynthesis
MTTKPGATVREFLTVLFARKLLMLAIFLAVVASGVGVTLLMEPAYESSMKILVTRDRIDPHVSAAENRPDLLRAEISEEEFNSELEILQSRQVLEGVVTALGLAHTTSPEPAGWLATLRARAADYYRSLHHQPAPTPVERAIARITDHLEVVSVKKSHIIKVSYRDANPERAAQLLNTLYRKYADHHLKLHQNSKAAQVFQEQTETFGQRLAEATEALKRFDAAHGVTNVSAQKELLLKQFYETQSLANAARTEIGETEQRIAALKTQLETQPERIETEARTKYVLALDKMKEELLTLELQHTQLLQKYKPDHRLLRDLEQRIAQARGILAREEQAPPQERAVALNDLHRRLMNELLSAQANLTALRERERSLTTLAAQYQAHLIEIDQKGFEKTDLERTRTVNEDAYLLYRKKAQEAEIINALNQEKVVNVSLADAASVNYRPASPQPLLNLAVFICVGLIAAPAGAVLAERLNPVVRSEDVVRRQLGLEVLASIPEGRS